MAGAVGHFGDTLAVENLAGLRRAFAVADKELSKELRLALREVAQPVQATAEQFASSSIPKIGLEWSRMRIGVTRTGVYVAPRKRGVKTRGADPRRRPNLALLLLERALLPALSVNAPRVMHEMEDLLRDVGKAWERAA